MRFENAFIHSVRMLKWTRRMHISIYIDPRNWRHSWFFVSVCLQLRILRVERSGGRSCLLWWRHLFQVASFSPSCSPQYRHSLSSLIPNLQSSFLVTLYNSSMDRFTVVSIQSRFDTSRFDTNQSRFDTHVKSFRYTSKVVSIQTEVNSIQPLFTWTIVLIR